jgi:hypothetical protein
MIVDQVELRHSVEALAKMYRLRDKEAVEPLWDPETREDIVAGTDAAIRKIEREIAVYLAQKYELGAREAEKVA